MMARKKTRWTKGRASRLRIEAGRWLLETSGLVIVFPMLDYFVQPKDDLLWLPWTGVVAGLSFLGGGLYLVTEVEK